MRTCISTFILLILQTTCVCVASYNATLLAFFACAQVNIKSHSAYMKHKLLIYAIHCLFPHYVLLFCIHTCQWNILLHEMKISWTERLWNIIQHLQHTVRSPSWSRVKFESPGANPLINIYLYLSDELKEWFHCRTNLHCWEQEVRWGGWHCRWGVQSFPGRWWGAESLASAPGVAQSACGG